MNFTTQNERFSFLGYELVSLDKTRMRGENKYLILDKKTGKVVKAFKSLKESASHLTDLCVAAVQHKYFGRSAQN